jgi:hypothetical protein
MRESLGALEGRSRKQLKSFQRWLSSLDQNMQTATWKIKKVSISTVKKYQCMEVKIQLKDHLCQM